MLMILSILSAPFDLAVRAGAQLRAVQPVRDRAEQDLVHERGLARPGHAGHAAEHAERELRRRSPSGCAARRPGSRSQPLRLAAAPPGRRSAACRRRNWPVSDCETRLHLRPAGPRRRCWPPCSPAPGPEVDDVVGGAHRALVVLDDDHGVAEVAQPRQHVQQLVVVALVQPDRGLVEDVEHADQARPDLRREPDPLRLAAGQRRRRPLERQVADADAVEEAAAAPRSPSGSATRSGARSRSARARRATRSPRAPTCA